MGSTVTTTELVSEGERRDRLGRRHVTRERRDELMAAFRESGLTREAFARREGLRYTTLCGWVQRQGRRSVAATRPAKAPTGRAPQIDFAEVARWT